MRMFDGFFKSKFCNESKTAIKATRMRLEAIKKKRMAVDKYLRKDIADLLRNELDVGAYCRAERLLEERNLTSCYDLVDQFCGCISYSHIVAMQKQSECPEECREAVSSLMYAAARFGHLPELRDLRSLFREKYGDSLNSFVNEEFVRRLALKSSSKDMKLQLMRDIAVEFSVDWNSKALEQRLFLPNLPEQERNVETLLYGCEALGVNALLGTDNDKNSAPPTNEETETNEKGLCLRKGSTDNLRKSASRSSNDDMTESYGNPDVHGIAKQSPSPASYPPDEEVMQKRPLLYKDIIPPYVKSKADAVDSVQDKPKPRSVRQRRLNKPPGIESTGFESISPPVNGVNREEKETDKNFPNKPDGIADKHAPARTTSLPPEKTMPGEVNEAGTGHRRSASLQPDMPAHHVHPNLPNYEDLVARLAALRGEMR